MHNHTILIALLFIFEKSRVFLFLNVLHFMKSSFISLKFAKETKSFVLRRTSIIHLLVPCDLNPQFKIRMKLTSNKIKNLKIMNA